ncbi:hypothetical protein FT663_00523 [Candidozyma haemuli var. vulneris]|uniref:FAD dependent oxidoreductase domain-containing protein n=1 Tax=Candidozyma haemuli TaxID=45357 RepID=A0A2V1B0Y4_9ASCO|nr:hypothetical protein CXQ85_003996 [[Candida] haemuloni]KAF3993249.1 hypothetical protein FT662_00629 [[Candida] haemuloni var. vulneris]KAF3995305.1 hypothetical protein FT663_00523 [[Candida] haemuloni var. vulneris]PVH23704.1 hypothetical protein CXQ85_003996 [[Candida] haemuloni]
MSSSRKVVVVGAGVVGLTSALQLKRADPKYDITIVAAHIPGDLSLGYASPYAGANWHSFAGKNDKRLQELDEPGYHEFQKLADNPQSGVWRRPNSNYYTHLALARVNGDSSEYNHWFGDFANEREINKEDLLPGTVYGTEFDGVVISVPIYLNYLLQECFKLGVTLKRISFLTNIDDALHLHSSGEKADLVINCAGLMAYRIDGVNDARRNFPVKGQVLLVRNNISRIICVEGFEEPNEMLYMFPRKEGGTIIGGSFLQENWDPQEDKALSVKISQRAVAFAPEIIDPAKNNPNFLDVVQVNVGLRPFRDGGMRIEVDTRRKWLIHNYGAGGGGYQGSYGFAKRVVELAAQNLPKL